MSTDTPPGSNSFTSAGKLIFCVLLFTLTACNSGGSDDGNGGGNTDTTAPTASVSTNPTSPMPDPALIPENTVFSITFSESMDTSSLAISGDMAGESDGGAWSQASEKNDTLTISPQTSWSANTHRTLVINARDLAGNALATLSVTRDVYNGFVYYVDSSMADDSGNGLSPVTAKKVIHTAVADATAPATILVSGGNYRLSHALNTHIQLRENVSLFGGYNADFTQRDPATNITTIEDRSNTATGSFNSPHVAIIGDNSIYPDPITPATVIDGFTLLGSTQAGADYTSAIFLNSASPTIQNNTTNGGSGSVTSVGMFNYNNASPVIQNNTVNGGSGDVSYAIFNSVASSPTIQNNTINGGSGSSSYAITNGSSSPTVQNNMIHGGSGGIASIGVRNASSSPILRNNTINGGSGTNSYAIQNYINSTATIQNNTIHGGSGGDNSNGIYNDDSSPIVQNNTISGGSGNLIAIGLYNVSYDIWGAKPSIANNLIFTRTGTGSYCLVEGGFASLYGTTPASLRNNDLFNCTVIYSDIESGCTGNGDGDNDSRTCTLSEMNALADIPDNGGNISTDPLFIDLDGADNDIGTMTDNNWHLSLFTSASVAQGGLNGSDQGWSYTDDKDGIARPASGNPWSIGAYEPVAFDHADYTGSSYTCASAGCHDGATPGVTGKPVSHADTTDVCASCHETSAWVPTTSPFDHSQVITTVCADCHDGSNSNISSKSNTHPETTDVCEACHTTTAWLSILLPFNHSQTTDSCVTAGCHSAADKTPTHPPTTDLCEACHSSNGWLPLLVKIDHNQTTGSCATAGCHSDGEKPALHIVTSQDCGVCHTTNAWLPTI